VEILFPLDGDALVVEETVSVRVRATDNVAVQDIVLESDGAVLETAKGPDLVHPFIAPSEPGTVQFEARARDFAGNTALASPVTVQVVPDPLTTVIGRVVTDSGPVEGATVTVSGLLTSSLADGTFEITGAPTVPRRVTIEVTTTVEGESLTGSTTNVFLVRGGTTNVGDIRIENQPEMVSVDLERTFMLVGSSQQVVIAGTPAISDVSLSVTVADTVVATISPSTGMGSQLTATLQALQPGTTTLTATYSHGETSVTTTALIWAGDIRPSPPEVPDLVPGDPPFDVFVTLLPESSTSLATFEILDESIATVNPSNTAGSSFETLSITPIGAGDTTLRIRYSIQGEGIQRDIPIAVIQSNQLAITLVPNPVHVLVGGRLIYTAEIHPFDSFETPVTFALDPDPGPARLENASLQSIDVVGVSPGPVNLTASATVQGNLEMTDPRTLTVLEPPIMDIVRQTATDTISIYDGSFVTGAIALTDQGLVLSLSNSTGTELVLSVTENVNEDPGPTDNLFVLQDTAAVGTGQFFATVEFPVAPGTSQRTLAFVPDSATKPGGLLDIQVRLEEPLIQSQTILAILVIEITPEGSGDPGGDPGSEAPEILSFTGQFDALTVQSPGQITVPHGIEGNLEAVGNTDSDSIRIEESTVEVDAFGAPVGTPTTSVVAVGLTGTDPPTLETTLAPPVDTSVILRRELTAIPLDTAGDPGISSTFTVTYEPAAALTLEITNLNPLGDMGNTVTSEDTSLVIGTVAGEPVRVALSSASEAQLLTLYQDEVVIAEEVGPVTRLPALPGTFIDVTMPPGSPFGTRIVLRGESLVDVGGNPVSTSTSNIEIQADNRPAVTNLTADSAFGIDAGGERRF